ncbi:MAG: methyltransferase domain-containing protein [Candidatus Omnitrophica bacterium]|nr:methyltransferase domain-containing protein [Candidatus Omnitrophota bacterium]
MYRWDAKGYSRNSANQKRWAQGLLRRIRFHGDESVLDIGCGDGKITCWIAHRVPRGRVKGIDNSHGMIRVACAARDGRYRNLSFVKKDACCLGMEEKFDVVFSNACFHWIPDQKKLLKSVYAALKPGGRLVVQMGAKGNFANMIKVSNKITRRKKWRRFFTDFTLPYYFFTPEKYAGFLKGQGFKVVAMSTFVTAMEFSGKKDCADSLRTIWMPYLHRVPRVLREALLDETVEQYIKDYPPDKKGTVRIGMKRLEFQARKPV